MSRYSSFNPLPDIFKAKTVEDNKWVYGWFVRTDYIDDDNDDRVSNRIYTEGERYEDSIERSGETYYNTKFYVVDPDTVRRFTGIYGNDGKRLWEGDIVKYQNKTCVIRYFDSNGCFYMLDLNNSEHLRDKFIYFAGMGLNDILSIEILGNDVDNSLDDFRNKSIDSGSSMKYIKGYFIETRENRTGKVFTLYDTKDREIGKYTVGNHQIMGYELCLNDFGYVNFDEFLKISGND